MGSRPLTLGFRYLFLFGLYAASLRRPDICRLLVSYRPLARCARPIFHQRAPKKPHTCAISLS